MVSQDVLEVYALIKGDESFLNNLKDGIRNENNQLVRMIEINKTEISQGLGELRNIMLSGLRQQIIDNNNKIRNLISLLENQKLEGDTERCKMSIESLKEILKEEENKEKI